MTADEIKRALRCGRPGCACARERGNVHCAAHDDKTPSLSVTERDGRVLVRCHRGCTQEAVIAALRARDLWPKDEERSSDAGKTPRVARIAAAYDYVDEAGRLLFQTVRLEPKGFYQRRPDGQGGWINNLDGVRLVPYRLPAVLEAVRKSARVFIIEGEKDADALTARGRSATTNPMGAGKWRSEFASYFQGARVIVLPDNDDVGRRHSIQVAQSLAAIAAEVKVLSLPGLPPKGDVSDWLAQGRTVEKLLTLADAAQPWQSDGPVVVPLSAVRPRAVEWIRPQRWARGKLGLVVGDPGFGKSCVILDAAARISTGAEWPEGGRAPHGITVILTAEDGLDDTVVPRLTAMGANLDNIVALTAIRQGGRERMFTLALDLPHLETVVRQRRPQAVFVDPLSAYLGRDVDSHVDADIRGLLGPLTKLAADCDAAIIAVMHLNKSQMKALYRVSGSIGFVAAARSVFAVVPDPEADDPLAPGARRFFAPVKMNLAPKPAALAFTLVGRGSAARVVWEGAVSLVDVEAALQGLDADERAERRAADAWLRGLLEDAGGSLESNAIREHATAAGFAWRTIQRAQQRLGVRAERKGGFGPDGYWVQSLPKNATRNDRSDEMSSLAESRIGTVDQVRALPKSDTSARVSSLAATLDGNRMDPGNESDRLVALGGELFNGEIIYDGPPAHRAADRTDANGSRAAHVGDPAVVPPPQDWADRQVVARRRRSRRVSQRVWATYRCTCGWTGPEPQVTHTALGHLCPRCGARVKRVDAERSDDEVRSSVHEPVLLPPGKQLTLWQAGVRLGWPRLPYEPGCSIAVGQVAWYTFARTAPDGDIDLALAAARKEAR